MTDTPQQELRRLEEDRHLNLFYCYGAREQDEEKNVLIENNLTRAFVQTVRFLSKDSRREFLKALFGRARHLMYTGDARGKVGDRAELPADVRFEEAEAALQGHLDRSGFQHQRMWVVTISRGDEPRPKKGAQLKSCPDAWLYKIDKSYCFLVESKYKPSNPINPEQIMKHGEMLGKGWNGKDWNENIAPDLIDLTWYDVLETIGHVLPELSSGTSGTPAIHLTPHERTILTHLWAFLDYYEYRLFRGFDLGRPWCTPVLELFNERRPP